jgi:hypothetical protein
MDTESATTRTLANAPPQLKPPNGTANRLPAILQAIFLASNQGGVMNDAPLDRDASMEFLGSASIAELDKNRQPISISSSSGSNSSSNNINKNSSFTLIKKRIPTKLALLKPVERNKTMVS